MGLIKDKVTVNSKGGGRREPVGLLGVFGQILVTKLQKVVKKAASEDIQDPDFSGVERVQEEEELSDGRADVERVEGLVEAVQLRQGFDQLGDVVLDVLLAEETRINENIMVKTSSYRLLCRLTSAWPSG